MIAYVPVGGDALASDLMWREIRKLSKEKPLVATMGDVAASGGYYMSMGAPTTLAQPLTLTGSIGVVLPKFTFAEFYDKVRPRFRWAAAMSYVLAYAPKPAASTIQRRREPAAGVCR